MVGAWSYTSVYPEVTGLAAWSENWKWYSSLPLGALYRYFVSQSSEFFRHNPLCCFSTSNTKGTRIFRYRLSPETFGYTLVHGIIILSERQSVCVCARVRAREDGE